MPASVYLISVTCDGTLGVCGLEGVQFVVVVEYRESLCRFFLLLALGRGWWRGAFVFYNRSAGFLLL
jgi:hypothetical protein